MASLDAKPTFQWVSRLVSVTAQHSSSGHQPNFAALKRGPHLYLAGWLSCWALAHILVFAVFLSYARVELLSVSLQGFNVECTNGRISHIPYFPDYKPRLFSKISG